MRGDFGGEYCDELTAHHSADLGDLPSLSAAASVGRMISYHFSDHISIKPAKHSQTTENTQHEDDVRL